MKKKNNNVEIVAESIVDYHILWYRVYPKKKPTSTQKKRARAAIKTKKKLEMLFRRVTMIAAHFDISPIELKRLWKPIFFFSSLFGIIISSPLHQATKMQ